MTTRCPRAASKPTRDLGLLPKVVMAENDYTYTGGMVPSETLRGKDGAGW